MKLEPFCLLADRDGYVACAWDLSEDPDGRAYWVDMFHRHFRTLLKFGIDSVEARGGDLADARARAERAANELDARLDAFLAQPKRLGRVTIWTLDTWRDGTLRKHGFEDPFLDQKNRENEKMLPLLPLVCRQIDALGDEREQLLAVVEGVFAGNIFDMGAEATAKAFVGRSPDFFATRQALPRRPWLIDDYDHFAARLLDGPRHRKCVFFIDNAGSDFLLGALPMMRWLARRGGEIILVANEVPTLNDLTIHDVRAWWPRIVEAEPSLASLPIRLASSGTAEPLIDLSMVSPQLNDAARDADLLVLEGMGRGVESNLDAEFICDSANLAMIKDSAVAKRHGGKVFDVICRYSSGVPIR
jgi:type II pantothenate kinase